MRHNIKVKVASKFFRMNLNFEIIAWQISSDLTLKVLIYVVCLNNLFNYFANVLYGRWGIKLILVSLEQSLLMKQTI